MEHNGKTKVGRFLVCVLISLNHSLSENVHFNIRSLYIVEFNFEYNFTLKTKSHLVIYNSVHNYAKNETKKTKNVFSSSQGIKFVFYTTQLIFKWKLKKLKFIKKKILKLECGGYNLVHNKEKYSPRYIVQSQRPFSMSMKWVLIMGPALA